MSLEAWGDGGGDDYLTPEQALEAGWLDPDTVEDLKNLFQHMPTPEPGDTSKSAAAFILMENILTPTVHMEGSDAAVMLAWAKVKLARNVLV